MIRLLLCGVCLVAAFEISDPAAATTCDCSQKLASCNAKYSYDGASISFTVGTNQCAEITYDVDGDPSAVTVTDGIGTVPYTPSVPGRRPAIAINSCSVCKTSN